MIYLKLLLSSSLIFIVTTLVIADNSIWLKKNVTPVHYNIKIAAYINDNKFYGESNVSIRIDEPTRHINLYSKKLCITDTILIDNLETSDENKEINIYKPKSIPLDDILNLYFTNEILSGHYILNMKFIGSMDDYNGVKIFNKKKYNNVTLAVSHFERYGARQIFPCWDEPSFHATFNISILYHENYKVFSNMPVKKEEADENSMLWTHFDTTPAMPTYLVSAIIINAKYSDNKTDFLYNKTDYSSNIDKKYNFTIWCRSEYSSDMVYARTVIKLLTHYLQNNWTVSKINSKVDHIIIPNFYDEDMINLGLIYYRESDIIYNVERESIGHKIKVARLIAYKVLHEWFHDKFRFRTSWCSTSWLNKAFVTFFGVYAIDKIFVDIDEGMQIMSLSVVQIQREVLHLDVDKIDWSSISQVKNSSLEIIPYKASILLRMILHAVGEEFFLQTMSLCINDYAINWINIYDFWEVLGFVYVSGQEWEMPISKQILDSIMREPRELNTWMKQKHYPVLKVIRNYEGTAINIVTIEIFNATETDLMIPLTYTSQYHQNFDDTKPKIWQYFQTDVKTKILTKTCIINITEISSDDWIIFNLQQTGYYRVNYDEKNWNKIIEYLNSEKYETIHVLNRAQIIDDAFHLMETGQLDSSIFWSLTNYLHQELSYVAWHPMFKALEYMSSMFLFAKDNNGTLKIIQTRIRNTINKLLEKIKYEVEVKDEELLIKCLREEAARWACLLGDETCKKEAYTNLERHLNSTLQTQFPLWNGWMTYWTYCNGLAVPESHGFWGIIYGKWRQNADHEVSNFLACTQNVTRIMNYLYSLKRTIPNPKNYHLRLQIAKNFLSTIAKHISTNDIFVYVLQHFSGIIPSDVNKYATLTVIIDHLYTEQQLGNISNYINTIIHHFREDKNRNDESSAQVFNYFSEERKEIFTIISRKIENRRDQIRNLNKDIQIFIPKKDLKE